MCLTSGFRIWTLYQILASVTNYNSVFTNAKIAYVAQKGKYVHPSLASTYKPLETCLRDTEYPTMVACYVMFSPAKKQCSAYYSSKCDNYVMKLLENRMVEDTTVYMRVTYTSSSTAVPTSTSRSLMPTVSNSVSSSVATVASSVVSPTATISYTAASTFTPQPTPSDLTLSSTRVYTVASNPTADYITPTPSEAVSNSIFISTPVTAYQEMTTTTTTSLETSDSTQPLMTEQKSDLPEVSPLFSISVSTTPSVDNTTSEEISSNITAGPSGFNNSVPTSSESPDKKLCPCKCRQSPLTEEELENVILGLRKELTVNKSTLSRTIRSKTSAPDNRTSATSMGMGGIVVLVSCTVFLVASDFPQLCQHAMIMKRNLASRFK